MKELKTKNELETEIFLNLMAIKNYSKNALYCLKSDDLTFIDKDEVIAYFSTVPSICDKVDLLMYDLVIATEMEYDNYE